MRSHQGTRVRRTIFPVVLDEPVGVEHPARPIRAPVPILDHERLPAFNHMLLDVGLEVGEGFVVEQLRCVDAREGHEVRGSSDELLDVEIRGDSFEAGFVFDALDATAAGRGAALAHGVCCSGSVSEVQSFRAKGLRGVAARDWWW